jgi:hypothetical protein
MAQSREAYWHFYCPECGFGDCEFGHLLADDEVRCLICIEEDGREVQLRRWLDEEPGQARLRGARVAA